MIVGYANDPKYVNVVGVVSKQCKIATSYCIHGMCVYEASQSSPTTDSCVSLLLACFSIGFRVGGYGGNHFTPLVSVLFMECQLHIMKIKSLILVHMSHIHANFRCKHTSIRTHMNMAIQIWQFLIDYTAMHYLMCSA